MCTAISYSNGDHYFGRNLDLECNFHETVTITPQNFPFHFQFTDLLDKHYAMIGVSSVVDGYPLYYEATNEFGLSMAGLNFPGNAVYSSSQSKKLNLAPYELIPWFLGQYKTVCELRPQLSNLNIIDAPFSDKLPNSPLHWMLSDKHKSIVLEQTQSGIHIYDNPVNVLTNNPPFPFHLQNLSNYLNLTSQEPSNRFSPALRLNAYSRGMGGIGLPGDLSSSSRFIRAAFTLHNSVVETDEYKNVNQFFHILGTVSQTSGCVKIKDLYEKTLYASCCNTDKLIYYYRTYYNSGLTAIRMNQQNTTGFELICFPLRNAPSIHFEN